MLERLEMVNKRNGTERGMISSPLSNMKLIFHSNLDIIGMEMLNIVLRSRMGFV